MSEPKRTKATKQTSGKKGSTATARHTPSQSDGNASPDGLHSTFRNTGLLWQATAVLALAVAVIYGITRFSTDQSLVDSSSASEFSAVIISAAFTHATPSSKLGC